MFGIEKLEDLVWLKAWLWTGFGKCGLELRFEYMVLR
jgi:hypothetical protein